jgi:hypothetical protein
MNRDDSSLDDRAPTIYGWVFALLGGGGILYFWVMGAVLLLSGNGGQIQMLQEEPFWRALYWVYPLVFVVALVVGGVLAALRRDLASVAAAGTPVALATLYYFALIHLRPV